MSNEKDIYKIIQDWHDLYKSGAITEEEFSDKKQELLTGKKSLKRRSERAVEAEIISSNLNQISEEEYNAEYEQVFNKKSWLGRNKLIVIIALFVIAGCIYLYFSNNEADAYTTSEDNSFVGQCYQVITPRSYFHNSPDVSTRRRAYLIATNIGGETIRPLSEEGDFVYIEFTNGRGQTSKGWILKQDITRCD